MTKQEFLSVLRGRITGRIPSGEVEAQIDYYSAYIDGRIGSGLTEEEAVGELGDPMLIAKTVVDSTDRAAEAAGYDGPYQSSRDTYADSDGINSGIFGNSGPQPQQQNSNSQDGASFERTASQTENRSGADYGRKAAVGGSLGCVIALFIFILVIAVIWVLVSFVFRISFRLLGWLLPVIAVVALVFLIISLVRRK